MYGRKYCEKEKDEGVVVARVFEKSPAAALRLQEGDIICAVNDSVSVFHMHTSVLRTLYNLTISNTS